MNQSYVEIDWALMDKISYRSKLGKSLKNTLRKFNKKSLQEVQQRRTS